MDEYYKLLDLLIKCEEELRDIKTSKEFSPSCSISEIAYYLYKNGVKTGGAEE